MTTKDTPNLSIYGRKGHIEPHRGGKASDNSQNFWNYGLSFNGVDELSSAGLTASYPCENSEACADAFALVYPH